jgi:hypothetical protein
MASIVLARSTAVLHDGAATGPTVVVSGLRVAEEAPATPALAPAGRSVDQATAPTKTPPASATVTSRPVNSQRLEGGRGFGSGAGGGCAAWACSRCCWRPET